MPMAPWHSTQLLGGIVVVVDLDGHNVTSGTEKKKNDGIMGLRKHRPAAHPIVHNLERKKPTTCSGTDTDTDTDRESQVAQ